MDLTSLAAHGHRWTKTLTGSVTVLADEFNPSSSLALQLSSPWRTLASKLDVNPGICGKLQQEPFAVEQKKEKNGKTKNETQLNG